MDTRQTSESRYKKLSQCYALFLLALTLSAGVIFSVALLHDQRIADAKDTALVGVSSECNSESLTLAQAVPLPTPTPMTACITCHTGGRSGESPDPLRPSRCPLRSLKGGIKKLSHSGAPEV